MERISVKIKGEYIKLSQLLKFAGVVYSGGEAGSLISDGQISVNGQVCTQKGKKIHAGDIIEVGKDVSIEVQ